MACQLNEVWPETLEMEGKGIGSCVDVNRLVGCLIPATHIYFLTCLPGRDMVLAI